MVNVINKRCGHPGCNKQPSYGVEGRKTAEFCAQHAKEGMVDVKNKRCGHAMYSSCNKHPAYGVGGSKTAKFCAGHKKEGMVNVKNKRCGHPGCNTRPTYGVEGSKTREFCVGHKKEGMVDVNSKKRCGHSSCKKHLIYGVEGSTTAEFCAEHKEEGMVNVISKRCGHPGCNKYPSYGVEGGKTAESALNTRRREWLGEARDGLLLDRAEFSMTLLDQDVQPSAAPKAELGRAESARMLPLCRHKQGAAASPPNEPGRSPTKKRCPWRRILQPMKRQAKGRFTRRKACPRANTLLR